MVDSHSYPFYGKSTGLFIQSSSKNDPFVFLKLIKEKKDGSWEKLKKGEGIAVKCNLEEIVMMLEVLKRNRDKWSTVHGFNEEKKGISFNWDKDNVLWVKIETYSKKLLYSQTEVMRMLLEHILHEKIEFSTVSSISYNSKSLPNLDKKETIHESLEIPSETSKEDKLQVVEETIIGDDITQIQGRIKEENNAALLIEFSSGKALWVAKSKIHSQFNSDNEEFQKISIESWLLRKNNVIT